MDIIVRPAVLNDLPILKAFEQGIVVAERPYDPTLKPDPISYYDLEEYIGSPDAVVMIAEKDGQVVGSGSARKKRSKNYTEPDYHAYLGFMFVPETHRGKGINKRITSALLDWAKDQGLSEVRLTVYSDNQPAIRAYEKAGFKAHLTEMRFDAK